VLNSASYIEGSFDHAHERGNVLCVEALVTPDGGDFSIKFEKQMLITETGKENLTWCLFDSTLTGTV
jgi:Xaa-Pro aminopeptidase